jgi:hypothetical protein
VEVAGILYRTTLKECNDVHGDIPEMPTLCLRRFMTVTWGRADEEPRFRGITGLTDYAGNAHQMNTYLG